MAALTITAANVKLVSGQTRQVTYGATITQGQPVRLDTADEEYKLCNNATAAEANATGVALTPGGDGEPGTIALAGAVVNIAATTVVGTSYHVGDSNGEIVPNADLGTADFVTVIGHGVATDEIKLTFNALGVAIA